jgi:hypothetical protein
MALENPVLNQRSFRCGIEVGGAEPHGMSASGTHAIAGLLFVIEGGTGPERFPWTAFELGVVRARGPFRLGPTDKATLRAPIRRQPSFEDNFSRAVLRSYSVRTLFYGCRFSPFCRGDGQDLRAAGRAPVHTVRE